MIYNTDNKRYYKNNLNIVLKNYAQFLLKCLNYEHLIYFRNNFIIIENIVPQLFTFLTLNELILCQKIIFNLL